jgi:hypothetical protein
LLQGTVAYEEFSVLPINVDLTSRGLEARV